MKGSQSSQQASPDDRGWWTLPTEDYWQALLEQGEIAPETSPPADCHEIFQSLGIESDAESSEIGSAGDIDPESESRSEWQSALLACERGDLFSLKVSGANRGGLLVEWNGLKGFVPASHLKEIPLNRDPHDRIAELAQRIGDSVTVRLIEVDAQQSRLVFSERAATSDFRPPEALLDTLQPGDVCQGQVTNLTSFGAFVDLGGIEGLIHISELSWDRVRHPSDVLHPGQSVKVHVCGVNPDEKRIALSLKRLRANPWTRLDSRYKVGDVIQGTVTNVVSFGAFVRVEEGIEGLIHVSELAEGNFLHPRNVVAEGDEVRVRVLTVDVARRRLGLSIRQAHDVRPSD